MLPFVLAEGGANPALVAFRTQLEQRLLRESAVQKPDPRFVPHVTLLYDPIAIDEHAIEPVVWQPREFRLVHSLLGRTEHRVLARWPIDAR